MSQSALQPQPAGLADGAGGGALSPEQEVFSVCKNCNKNIPLHMAEQHGAVSMCAP